MNKMRIENIVNKLLLDKGLIDYTTADHIYHWSKWIRWWLGYQYKDAPITPPTPIDNIYMDEDDMLNNTERLFNGVEDEFIVYDGSDGVVSAEEDFIVFENRG